MVVLDSIPYLGWLTTGLFLSTFLIPYDDNLLILNLFLLNSGVADFLRFAGPCIDFMEVYLWQMFSSSSRILLVCTRDLLERSPSPLGRSLFVICI